MKTDINRLLQPVRRQIANALITSTIAIAFLGMFSASLFAQLPSPCYGWNLGNTMEATCGVGCWSPLPTQALINAVANAGFNTVRIPCAWDTHANQSTYAIDPTYMAQVKQVVDWCVARNLYIELNCHWDGGWLDNNLNSVNSTTTAKMNSYWTQIANTFKSYSSRLMFAAANEPPASTAAQTSVLMNYYQTFVNAVRATGGNNSTRYLILSGPSTDIDLTDSLMNTLPSDPSGSGRFIVEVHFYTPYQFTLMGSDQSWGSMFYFWGNGYHSTTLPSRNATWGEEAYLDSEFQKMYNKFTSKGIQVIVGEFGAYKRGNLTGDDYNRNYASTTYWNNYVVTAANNRGMKPIFWNTPGYIFDWTTGAVTDQNVINSVTGRGALPPPGSGSVANGTYKIIARHSGKAMDAYGWGTADGTQIDQWTYGGGNNQRWTVTDRGSGQYSIINVNAGKGLDINGYSTANGAKVQLWTYGGGNNQKFIFTATSSGYYRITPVHATGSCLDVNGGSTADGALVQLWTYGGGNNQQWSFQTP